MTQYTNQTNLPTPIAVWLAHDTYDKAEAGLSATSLMKPTRQIILTKRVPEGQGIVDVASLVKSRMGTAIHDAIERAWISPKLPETLASLGVVEKVIKRVVVNPVLRLFNKPTYPIYMELRETKEVLGTKISGKYDFIEDGHLFDFKSTGTFSYTSGSKDNDYVMQGSIYRWLNPDIITDEFMSICFIFTDWSKVRYLSDPRNYPPAQILAQKYKLLPVEQVQVFVENKVKEINFYSDKPESELPLCTDKELWRKPDVYKYYKNPQKTAKSTANFETLGEANQRYLDDGAVGIVKLVKGGVSACTYCSAFTMCTQKDKLIESGELKL